MLWTFFVPCFASFVINYYHFVIALPKINKILSLYENSSYTYPSYVVLNHNFVFICKISITRFNFATLIEKKSHLWRCNPQRSIWFPSLSACCQILVCAEAAKGGARLKKSVHKNFAKFKRKHLYQSLVFDRFTGLRPSTSNNLLITINNNFVILVSILFGKYFWTTSKGVFRTLSNIVACYFCKRTPSWEFQRILNTPWQTWNSTAIHRFCIKHLKAQSQVWNSFW